MLAESDAHDQFLSTIVRELIGFAAFWWVPSSTLEASLHFGSTNFQARKNAAITRCECNIETIFKPQLGAGVSSSYFSPAPADFEIRKCSVDLSLFRQFVIVSSICDCFVSLSLLKQFGLEMLNWCKSLNISVSSLASIVSILRPIPTGISVIPF